MSDRWTEEDVCRMKVAYSTEETASVPEALKDGYRPYHCVVCQKWHLGTKATKKRRRAKPAKAKKGRRGADV